MFSGAAAVPLMKLYQYNPTSITACHWARKGKSSKFSEIKIGSFFFITHVATEGCISNIVPYSSTHFFRGKGLQQFGFLRIKGFNIQNSSWNLDDRAFGDFPGAALGIVLFGPLDWGNVSFLLLKLSQAEAVWHLSVMDLCYNGSIQAIQTA
jgi:hypothetical protein